MAKELKPFEEMTTKMEKATENTMEQGQKAMENHFSWLQKSMSGSQWADNNLTKTLIGNTEHNIAATQVYVQKLSQAKDIQDVIKIQTDFLQAQMSSFAEQTKELGEIYMKTIAGGMKTPFSS